MLATFSNCRSLTSVPLFNTTNVVNMFRNFYWCSALQEIPLFDTSNVNNMEETFFCCFSVNSGALALYQQASTQTTPPSSHNGAFHNCGEYTQTGSVELAQIPSDWK
jgi:surface protein